MKQAIVIENPKWEKYTDAQAKFKSLKGEGVLVMRGNNKEIGTNRAPKKLVKKQPETPEELAANLRKEGRSKEDIEKAVKAFKK